MNIYDNLTKSIPCNIIETIGNTPLIHLNQVFNKYPYDVLAKLESFNPGGSIKDRTSVNILRDAILMGRIKAGDTIIESSSGNMALGLAQACLFYNLKLIVVVDPKINSHTEKLLTTYGAKIDYIKAPDSEDGYLGARLKRVAELLEKTPNSFWTNQYKNKKNPEAHHFTMNEIYSALEKPLDYIFITVSTCGTLMGCAEYIKRNNLPTKVIAVDAIGSILFGKEKSDRLIPGHGSSVMSQFLNKDLIHDFVEISDLECVEGCWSLLRDEGILAGGSSGGSISAIKKYAPKIPELSTCGMFICDRGERYLDTVYNTDWITKNLKISQEKILNITRL